MRDGLWLASLLVLAGCSSSGGDSAGPTTIPFDDITATATPTTGIILGIVVDERIVPIPGAEVTVAGGAFDATATTSDELGRFTFTDLPPGDYFLTGRSPLHKEIQTSVTVVAGVDDPDVVRLQLPRIYQSDPFSVPIEQEGYFDCSQGAGIVYSSSNCVTNYCRAFEDAQTCAPLNPLDNVTNQEREWHMDVESGWQQIVFEMTWEPSAQATARGMGLVVSTYKPTRNTAHFFSNYQSCNPLRGQLDVGVTHESGQAPDGTPEQIPPEGMPLVSYFASVRTCADDPQPRPPAIAVQQKFNVYIHQFYYGVPKEGWSFVAGDSPPF